MKDILLVTLNSTYQHAAFGLRYLYANLKEFQPQTEIVELTIAREPRDIVEKILSYEPKVVGFGVYIWNTKIIQEVVSILKKVKPEIVVVLGGPEVSYETEGQALFQTADFIIKGEADFLFYEFCRDYFNERKLPAQKIVNSLLPDIKSIASPYRHYTEEDIKNRYIYVEASRGCPYKCEYCLSSLDKSVRSFDLETFLGDLDDLIAKGARGFKFIDRTFNLSVPTCTRILQFFLDRMHHGLFLHFEMVPDRLPEEIRGLIGKFPAGSLQFEIGIQTWNIEVARLVSRRNDYEKVRENFKFLRAHTQVHSHADLIVGLPGETIESFAQGFDTLAALEPDEIQVGLLKRLKGAPIIRHDREWQMVYQDHPPFQILSTKTLSFERMQKMTRFAKYWDLYANSGQFKNFVNYLKEISALRADASFFWQFYDFSEFLSQRHAQSFGLSLVTLTESAWAYLQEQKLEIETAREMLLKDYSQDGRREPPPFLRTESWQSQKKALSRQVRMNKRQQRHLEGSVTDQNPLV